MRSTPLSDLGTGPKLSRQIDPIGTTQLIRIQTDGVFSWFPYKVYDVTGAKDNVPNQDEPLIFLELEERHPGTPQQYMVQPLSFFLQDQKVLPEKKTDKFWDEGKTVKA